MGYMVNTKHDLVNYKGHPDMTSEPNCERCHSEIFGIPSNLSLGTNLGDDHPISMDYPAAGEDDEFNTPPDSQDGWGDEDIKLVRGKVECVSCHDVHDPQYTPFLRKPNDNSIVCLTCHIK